MMSGPSVHVHDPQNQLIELWICISTSKNTRKYTTSLLGNTMLGNCQILRVRNVEKTRAKKYWDPSKHILKVLNMG